MRLLLHLARQPGEVVSIDDLLDHVWAGTIVTPDSVYQTVASLRRLLGDASKQPQYIATVPRMGYRMVATVSAWSETSEAPGDPSNPGGPGRFASRRGVAGLMMVGALALWLLAAALVQVTRAAGDASRLGATRNAAIRTIAILPFRDMSPTMDQEVLADDLTEDLIDRLDKVPRLRAAPPGSSFSLKGRKLTAPEAAKILGVDFVVDGSVRRSGSSARIVVRLVRAHDGLVVWSETYQRAVHDLAPVLDSVAAGVDQAATPSPQREPIAAR